MTITQADPATDAAEGIDWVARAIELATQLAPDAIKHDRDGTFVTDAFERLRGAGFLGAPVPAELGGGGATHSQAGAVLTELAKGCPATAVTLSMHYHLVCTQVWRHRHGQPAEPMLRKVAADQPFLVSTGASDWVSSSGRATKVDGGFRVSGRKGPASGAPIGDMLVTSIAWADAPDGASVLHCSIPAGADGVHVDHDWDVMGLRGTGSHSVVFDDVFVPDAAVSLIRPADEWHGIWDAVLGTALPLIMAAYLGIAERAAEQALERSSGRHDQLTESLVGEMMTKLIVARDMVDAMFAAADDLTFAPSPAGSSVVLARKTVVAQAVIDVVGKAMEICGGEGFATAFGLERLYRDAHGGAYHPLPAAKQRVFTGRVALGRSPVAPT